MLTVSDTDRGLVNTSYGWLVYIYLANYIIVLLFLPVLPAAQEIVSLMPESTRYHHKMRVLVHSKLSEKIALCQAHKILMSQTFDHQSHLQYISRKAWLIGGFVGILVLVDIPQNGVFLVILIEILSHNVVLGL